MSRLPIVAITVALLFPALVVAGKVKTVTASAPAHFDKAQLQQVVVSSEGTVRLARAVKPLGAEIDASRIWDVVEDAAGNLFVATGDEGKIFKIAADGKVTTAFDSEDSQILCLLAAADGSIYAGTGPSGLIVRIDSTGNARILYDSPESYIWGLTFDEKTKTVYAATGPHGRVYAITADGKANVFFQAKQDHILSLARADDGTLYAGTDKQGLVYRVDAKGKGFVLFQAAQAEVRCLVLTDGALYAGTSAPAGARGASSSSAPSTSGGLSMLPRNGPEATRASENSKAGLAASGTREKGSDTDRGNAASAMPAPSSGENSVYRIGFDGAVREVFREKGLVLSVRKQGDRLFVATGAKGQLFEIHEATRERNEVTRLDHGQVQRLLPRRDGSIIIAGSDPAKLYVMHDRFAPKGTLVSEVIDAKLVSQWGSLSWQADTPKGTSLGVAVRAGNVAEPDDTWSDWSAEQTDAQKAAARVPNSRYLQYRVSLTSNDPAATPALNSLSIRHATLNQAPEITSLDVPNLDAANAKEPKRVRLKWSATDANEDELAFDVYVRKEGWKEWVRIEEAWNKNEYEWDTTTLPSGSYQVKIVASDRPDNNEESALTGERVAGPIVVAHEAPTVTVKFAGLDKNRAKIEAAAVSELVRLSSASFALDGGKWTNIYPTDGLFDAKNESFRFLTEALSPGIHVVVLKVRDAAGNTGSADVVFTVEK